MVTSTVDYALLLLISGRLSLKQIVTDLSEIIALLPETSYRSATWRAGKTDTVLFLRNWLTVFQLDRPNPIGRRSSFIRMVRTERMAISLKLISTKVSTA